MRRDLLLAGLLALGALAGAARADIVASPGGGPRFSDPDLAVVARNASLAAILARDPWLVRRILDLQPGAAAQPGQAADPDLGAPRDAAGSVEWIALIERARAERDALGSADAPSTRSSEGSVEMIELMRRARQLKAP